MRIASEANLKDQDDDENPVGNYCYNQFDNDDRQKEKTQNVVNYFLHLSMDWVRKVLLAVLPHSTLQHLSVRQFEQHKN